tara:strand:+ start:856 stop:2979 length:2124 start_codon:yes stop_codon:yes gene_type:complete
MYIAIGNSIGASSRVNAGGGGGGFNNTYSLAFDGVDDYVDCGNISDLNGVTTATWSIWAKKADTSDDYLMSCYSATGSLQQYLFHQYSDKLYIYLANSSGTLRLMNRVDYTFNVDEWYHIAIIYNEAEANNSDKVKVYINGNLEVNQTAGFALTSLRSTTASTNIGKAGGFTSKEFGGNIDEVAIFNSVVDIADLWNGTGEATDLSSISGLTNWYRMGDNGTFKSPQWLIPNNENKTKFSNYSFLYDGVDDYIDTGITTTGTNDVSISCWIKTSETFAYSESRCAFGGYNNVSGSNYTLGRLGSGFATPNDMQVRVYNTLGTTKLNDGNWHNIIYTHNYTTKETKAYVDGNTTPEAISTFAAFSANFRIAIGWNGATSSFYFEGNVDECAYFTSILGASDVTSIYNSGVPTDISSLSPVGYWRSEQSNFTDNWLVDNSALSNYSTRSFNFDGVDDRVDCGATLSDLGITGGVGLTSTYTLSCWVKFDAYPSSGKEMFFGASNILNQGLALTISGNTRIYAYSNSSKYYSVPVSLNTWYFVAYTDDGINRNLYINGLPDTTQFPQPSPTNLYLLRNVGMGSDNSGTFSFNGNVDEACIYTTALTPAEILAMYNGGEPARIEGAVAHWRMGEDATFNTNWNVPDQVGSATGTSANMTIADLEGEAPNYTGGGLSNNMTIEDRVGDASNSSNNALSYNMDEADREENVPS